MRLRARIILCLVFLCLSHGMAGQNNSIFQAVLVDRDGQSVEGALIRNRNNKEMAVSDKQGFFSIKASNGDSLLVMAMSYEFKIILAIWPHELSIELKPLSIQLKEVEILDYGSWELFKEDFLARDIPEERIEIPGLPKGRANPVPIPYRSNEFPNGPKLPNYILSPFSSIAYAFNKDEKQKRKMRRILSEEWKTAHYWKVVNNDTIQSYLPVPDSLIEEFVVYCHSKIEDKSLDNTFYYQEMIRSLYTEFMNERVMKE